LRDPAPGAGKRIKFCGCAAMSTGRAVEKLRALGVAAFTDPVALVKAAAKAVG
jgi:hypothetical protein